MSTSEGRASTTFGIVTTGKDTTLEVGKGNYRLCEWVAVDTFYEGFGLGDCGQTHEICSFHTCLNRLLTSEVGQIVCGGNSTVAWCASIDNFGPRPKVYISILAEVA